MANALYTPANMADAIDNLAGFYSGTMGWTVTNDPGNGDCLIELPGKTAKFRLGMDTYSYSSSSYGGLSYELLLIDMENVASPFRCGANWIAPITRMYVFAGETPEPWSLITFETAPNYFVHAYLGYMDKLGSYNGGAVCDASFWGLGLSSDDRKWDGESAHLLFGGWNDVSSSDRIGGLQIDDVAAPSETYFFTNRSGVAKAGGGFGDAYSFLLSGVEHSGIDGGITFHPITLFADLASDGWHTPVGCVPGVRAVNLAPFQTGEVITVGGEDWQVFPLSNRLTAYGARAADPAGHPGNLQPDSGGNYDYNMGLSTENYGIAVLRG